MFYLIGSKLKKKHQLTVKALGATQGNTSLAPSCIQVQLWIRSVAAAIIREGGTLPTEIWKQIWDKASNLRTIFNHGGI